MGEPSLEAGADRLRIVRNPGERRRQQADRRALGESQAPLARAVLQQQVRDPQYGTDLERGWGPRRSVARDYLYEIEPALGTSRLGPDLANVGGKEWRNEDKDAVLVSPAHTFLMMNRPVRYQFWLDPGSSGWFQRLIQPLTHPYVLSRGWEPGRSWADADEVQTSTEAMARLISGLLLRCRERVYLGISELGESGFEQRGELLRAFQKVLTSSS